MRSAERGRLVQALGTGSGSHFGAVQGRGVALLSVVCNGVRRYGKESTPVLGVKSGGTACSHVLMDVWAFIFLKNNFDIYFQEVC